MKNRSFFVVLLLFSWSGSSDAVATVATSGCPSLNLASSEFVLPATDFSPLTIDVDACRYQCALQNFE